MAQQANSGRTLAREVKTIRRALQRIAKHPVVSARKIAVMQVEAECLRVFPNKEAE